MNKIRVSKELLINLGNFSNIKIVAEVISTETNFEEAWKELNKQISDQENIERATRLTPPAPKTEPKEEVIF